jgi:NAD(P)-dependent dehydrogenase (short-subunit alcohol dehydrogenase family)
VARLAPVPQLARNRQRYLDSESIVIATGGGRGVTATLVEQLLEDVGCRVIAVGRTDPTSVPDHIRAMDGDALQRHETAFYQDRLKRDPGTKIVDLRRQYLTYRAANEIAEVVQRLQRVGRYEYRCLDITDGTATEAFVASVYREHGRVDLVLHGAGIQVSKSLAKKSLRDFRQIIATKLGGLSNLYQACERHRQGSKVHYHLLTSAFSYVGNDGQCDYGAANEAMNRLAVSMSTESTAGHWSSLAWLGWAGVGMTRDSEFAALAASRGLRGVTRDEGRRLFSDLMRGSPTTPANILLAPGEIDYYQVPLVALSVDLALPEAPPTPAEPASLAIERAISAQTHRYVLNHLVDGIPTVPGALIIAIVAEAAQQLRPMLKIVGFEQARFHRFIRVHGSKRTLLRVQATVSSEGDGEAAVRVRLLSDFVHRNGTVLQKDVLQHESTVRMASALRHPSQGLDPARLEGRPLPDPYIMDGSPLRLSGPFRTMTNIAVGGASRRADYRLGALGRGAMKDDSLLRTIMLMDSLWRFGAIEMASDGSLPVYVPETCDVMRVHFDFLNADPQQLTDLLRFTGANPRPDGDKLHIGPVTASDVSGNPLLTVEGGVCRRVGEVRPAPALQATVV